jgi:hypothetical protein
MEIPEHFIYSKHNELVKSPLACHPRLLDFVTISEIANSYPPLAEVSRSDGGGLRGSLIVAYINYGIIKNTSTPCPRQRGT